MQRVRGFGVEVIGMFEAGAEEVLFCPKESLKLCQDI